MFVGLAGPFVTDPCFALGGRRKVGIPMIIILWRVKATRYNFCDIVGRELRELNRWVRKFWFDMRSSGQSISVELWIRIERLWWHKWRTGMDVACNSVGFSMCQTHFMFWSCGSLVMMVVNLNRRSSISAITTSCSVIESSIVSMLEQHA